MTYSCEPHFATLIAPCNEPSSEPAIHFYALIDAGQLDPKTRTLQSRVPNARCIVLFDGTFARSAPSLSPLLFELAGAPEELTAQLSKLNAACQGLPVLSVLHTTLTLEAVAEHLRTLLKIEADGTAYLLRFADTQMLLAANAALTPGQRSSVMGPFTAWYTVDHRGTLANMADTLAFPHAQPAVPLPLVLNAQQTHALLDGAKVPMLASQVRHRDERFEQLTHAQQTEFVAQCVEAAVQAGVTDEGEVLQLTLERWDAAAPAATA